MYTDKTLMFSEEQDDIIAAGTILGLKSVDLGATKGTRGPTSVSIFAQVDDSFDTGGGITFQVICSAAEAMSSPDVIASSRAYTVAELVAGLMVFIDLPDIVSKRYLGIQYVATEETGAAWAGETAIAEDALVVEEGASENEVWQCTTAGTTSDTEPTWVPGDSPITDGTAVWTYVRLARPSGGKVTAGLVLDAPIGAY